MPRENMEGIMKVINQVLIQSPYQKRPEKFDGNCEAYGICRQNLFLHLMRWAL